MLYVCAIAGSFAALCAAGATPQLMAILNAELQPANLILMKRRGFGSPGHRLTKRA
jgi:hypothetical protein